MFYMGKDDHNHSEMEFLKAAIDAIADPIFVKDEKHRWVVLNKAFSDFIGIPAEEMIGKSDFDFFPEEEAAVFWEKDREVFESQEVVENEEVITLANGKTRVIVTRKNCIRLGDGRQALVGCIRDITELRQQQNFSEMQSRLASLGELVGGIAHEVNNPLCVVLGKLSGARRQIQKENITDSTVMDYLDAAEEAGFRIQNIFSSMRRVIRGENGGPLTVCSVREICNSLASLSHDYLNEHRVKMSFEQVDNQKIACRAAEVLQVLINLVRNSVQALGEDENPWIRIMVENGDDRSTVIRVVDSGGGLAPEVQDRLFEPFFSTKSVGVGMGLGLSISRKLIEANQGELNYELHDGHTSFLLKFPHKVAS